MKIVTRSIALCMLTLSSHAALAGDLPAAQQKQLQEIEKILQSNPALIPQLHQSLNQYVNAQVEYEKQLAQHHDWLYSNPKQPFIGNPDSKNIIINFTDYNCPYCKKLEVALEKIVSEVDDIKVVNIFVPIKHMMSQSTDVGAAQYSLKVWQHQPKQFSEVNRLLFAKNGLHDSSSLQKVANKTDTASALENDAQVAQLTAKNYQAFSELGLQGTPAMIINGQVLAGYLPYPQLKEVIVREITKS